MTDTTGQNGHEADRDEADRGGQEAALAVLRPRLAWFAALAVVGAALFVAYLGEARAYPVNSDGAGNALQAWDMLHGNLLLHGWWLSDVSFYTTELPEYMLGVKIAGLHPGVVPLCAAFTYTLLVMLTALVAKGQAKGREGIIRAVLAGTIMAAPGPAFGSYALLSSPDHTGTGVPILLILLLLDRLDRTRARHWLPPLVFVLLVWVQVADAIATLAATVPIAVACLVRAVTARRRQETPWRDVQLTVAALASVPVTSLILITLRNHGGFYLHPYPGSLLSHPAAWPGQARILGNCLLTLFGASTTGQPVLLAVLHFAGLAAAAVALLAGIAAYFRRDRVDQILVLSVLAVLAAAEFSHAMTSILSIREIVPVLPVSAALAGRVFGPVLARLRTGALAVPLTAISLCYLAALGYYAAQPVAPAENQELADWLQAHHLFSGLSGYWQANSVTLNSGGTVMIAAIFGASPYAWESRSSWYDPALSQPNFIVTVSGPAEEQMYARPSVIRRVYGRPAAVYHFGRYTILVFTKNLLTDVGPVPRLPPAMTIATAELYDDR